MSVKINNETYKTFSDIMNDNTVVSPEIKAEVEFETALIGKIIEAREEKGLSQRELAELSGVKQPAIARLESGMTIPRVDTLIRLLVPLGKTIAIVPIEDNK